MPLLMLGINHQTADIALREQVFFHADQLSDHYTHLKTILSEVVILSTCNRTEIYGVTEEVEQVAEWLLAHYPMHREALRAALYRHQDETAVAHLMRVVCGLDSMVMGEPHILGQVKDAFSDACRMQSVGTQLTRLFPRSFSVAKRIRTSTALGACPMSLAAIVARLIRERHLQNAKILIVGAGVTGSLVLKYLYQNKLGTVWIANRTLSRAEALSRAYVDVTPVALADLPAVLSTVDVVITATTSATPIIFPKMLGQQPLLCIDLAVPRNIDSLVGKMPHVTLFMMDDLHHMIEHRHTRREHAIEQAEHMIVEEVEHFMRWQQSLNATEAIRAYREHVENLRAIELEKALTALRQGENPEIVLNQFAHNLSNKCMHMPSVNLKKAGYEGRLDVLALTHHLFELKEWA